MKSQSSEPMLPDMDIGVRGHPLSQDVMDRPEPVTSSRIVETLQRYPAYVIPLATLTAAFLVVDLAFAARLLDTTGGSISEQQLGALEAWGWGLGGVALMLLVWGSFILPRGSRNEWPMRRKGIAFVLSAIVSLETVYLVGPALTGRLEDRATAMERQCAVQLRVLAVARQENAAPITPPAIQSVIISAPYMGFSCDSLPPASRNGLREAMEGMVSRRIGTAEQLYDYVFIPSVRSLRDAYNEYVIAQLRLVADIRAIPDQQAQAWQRFLDRLAQGGLTPTRVPRRDWSRVAADVGDMGVQVPSGWNPADKPVFMEAVATALRKTADAVYNEFVVKHFQGALPPGLDWNGFTSQPRIQARWRTMIDAPAEATLTPNMGFAGFRQTVYEPRVDRLVQPLLDDLLGPSGSFLRDGGQGHAGSAAVHWLMVPAVLLGVTLLCILFHSTRLFDLGCRILLSRIGAPKRWAVEACTAAIVILLVGGLTLRGSGPSSSSDAARSAQQSAELDGGGNLTGPIRALWGVGAALRMVALADFDFGYNPGAAGDLSGTSLKPLLLRLQAQPRP